LNCEVHHKQFSLHSLDCYILFFLLLLLPFHQLNSRKNAVAQSWVVGNRDSGGVRTVATARCGGSSSSSQEADNGKEETPDREPTCTLLPT
jgi:hypothetical protein